MADNKQDKELLLTLIGKLPEELQEEGSTGRELIDSIIYEARKGEGKRIHDAIIKKGDIQDIAGSKQRLLIIILSEFYKALRGE